MHLFQLNSPRNTFYNSITQTDAFKPFFLLIVIDFLLSGNKNTKCIIWLYETTTEIWDELKYAMFFHFKKFILFWQLSLRTHAVINWIWLRRDHILTLILCFPGKLPEIRKDKYETFFKMV